MKENISTAGVQQYFSIRAQCIRSDSASRPRRHAGSCKIILEIFRQKEYQQFRLKKPGGAGVKLFQAIKAVNQGCSVTLPSRCRHAAGTPDGCTEVNFQKNYKLLCHSEEQSDKESF